VLCIAVVFTLTQMYEAALQTTNKIGKKSPATEQNIVSQAQKRSKEISKLLMSKVKELNDKPAPRRRENAFLRRTMTE